MAPNKLVLVVDDDEDIRASLAMILEANGYEPITAGDGEDGLRKARQSPPSIILLDLMMPGKSGVQFLNEIKQDESLRTVPVVVQSAASKVTGVDMKTYLENLPHRDRKAKALGVDTDIAPDAYLEKPIDPEAMLETLRRLT